MYFKKVYIEITNICNKRCSFCSIDHRKKEEMTVESFEHILKEISPYTDYLYLHVKGEPLLHSKLKEILMLCEQYHKTVNLTTNGTLLKKELSTLLSVSNIRQINISLHSFEGEEHYMEDILECTKKILKNTNMYINYRFWALKDGKLTNQNQQILQKIEQEFQKPLLIELENNGHVTIKPHLFIELGDEFEWPTLFNSYYEEYGTCYGLRAHFAILVDGTVIPCCLDSDAQISLGNIFTTPLSQILQSNHAQNIISGFQNYQKCEELCKHCTYSIRFLKAKEKESS